MRNKMMEMERMKVETACLAQPNNLPKTVRTAVLDWK